jgi:hypothetical protein
LFANGDSQVGQCSFNIHDRGNPQGARLFAGGNAQICEKCIRACEVLKSSLALSG